MPPKEAGAIDLEETPVSNSAPEEDSFKEETPQSSWDSLDQEFDEADGVGFVDEDKGGKEPSEEDDALLAAEAAPEPEAKEEPPVPEASEKPAEKLEEEPAPEPKAEEPKPEVKEEEPPPQVEEAPQLSDAQRQELRSQALKQLTESYQLTEEQASEFETEPAKALPKLAAELQLRVYETVVSSIMQQLPSAMEGFMQAQKSRTSREDKFFQRWPELKSYKQQAMQVAAVWRQMNPQAAEEEAREEIGKMAMAALGLFQVPQAETPPPQTSVRTPAAPPTPPRQRTTSKTLNPFEQLADEWSMEEDHY